MELLHSPEYNDQEVTENSTEPRPPHEAIFLVLAYLPLIELLAVSQVCKSLRDALRNDVLPWLHIAVYRPQSSRLSDEILLRITSKAGGRLRTLVLINCTKITDDGLQSVVVTNHHISKLHIPSCTGLTPEGVIRAVETLTKHNPNFRSLKINGIYNINRHHLDTLCSLIGVISHADDQDQPQRQKLYHEQNMNDCFSAIVRSEEETTPSIDVGICPKCNEVRMVFDCPREETCNTRKRLRQLSECKGCYFCIPRCQECGVCVEEAESAACCPDILCSDCWFLLPKCSFCNKPYCNQHVNEWCSVPGSSGLTCQACQADFIENEDERYSL